MRCQAIRTGVPGRHDRPGIARPVALAVHVAAAVRARAEYSEWLCLPDEPEWLHGTEAAEDVILGVARPSVLEATGTAGVLSELFIDCHWPLGYLPAA